MSARPATTRPHRRPFPRRASWGLLAFVLPGLIAVAASQTPSEDVDIVQPLIEQPLRAPAICRGPDGTYYLTGASASMAGDRPDFANNHGIYLWKSQDLKDWQPLGKVWSLDKDAPSRWTRMKGVNPSDPTGEPVRGVAAPEIHYLKGTFWIPFSMSHGGSGLLKSRSGKAEGPYEYVGLMTIRGSDPSLFEDVDGAVYWVFGEGWIARMKDDLSDLAESPRLLQPEGETYEFWGEPRPPNFPDHRPVVGSRGAFLFRENGEYHLCAADYRERLGGHGVNDTFVASSKNLLGPYGKRQLMIPHGGQTTVFRDDKNNLYATVEGDAMAVLRDRAGIVPLRYDGFLKQVWKPNLASATNHPLPHPVHRAVVLEDGPVGRLRPIDLPGRFEGLRDPHILNAPDGYYYLVATVAHSKMPDPSSPGIYAWRSKDLKTWVDMGEIWNVSDWTGPGSPYRPQPPRFAPHLPMNFEGIWSPRMYFIKGNYYLAWGPSYGGCYLLKSKTGKPEGPYESVPFEFHPTGIAPAMLEDEDGSVYYLCTGGVEIAKMNDDMTGLAEPLRRIGPADGSDLGFEGPFMIKAHGKYILFLAQNGEIHRSVPGRKEYQRLYSYDWMYCWADSPYGPYSTARLAVPHAGDTCTFQGKDGQWYNTVFGSDSTAPFTGRLGIVPLSITWNGQDMIIRPVSNPIPGNPEKSTK